MEKRWLLFLVLSFAVLQLSVLWMRKNAPPPAAPPPALTETVTVTPSPTGEPSSILPAGDESSTRTAEPPAERAPAPKVEFRNELYAIDFSTRGAVPVRWDIIDPRFVVQPHDNGTTGTEPREGREALIDPELEMTPGVPLPFELVLRERNRSGFYSQLNSMVYDARPVEDGEQRGWTFRGAPTESGLRVDKTFLFSPKSFLASLRVDLYNDGQNRLAFDNGAGGLGINLGPGLGRLESTGGYFAPANTVDVVLNGTDKFTYEHLEDAGESARWDLSFRWGGIQSLYFLSTLVAPEGQPFVSAEARLDRDLLGPVASEKTVPHYPSVEMYTPPFELEPGAALTYSYGIYMGPKQHRILEAAGNDLDRVLFHNSMTFFRPLLIGMMWLLDLFHRLTMSWGLAIILLTFTVRLLAFPLVQKGIRANKKMMDEQRRIKPLMDKLNEKYKNDPQKKQQEIFKLYREHNINPFGMLKGCGWMLIQLPIFIALYKLLYQSIDLRGAPFLWWSDLSQPDRLIDFGMKLPLLGWESFNLLPIIVAVSQMFSSKYMQTSVPTDPQQEQMQKMMIYFMPLFLLFVTYGLPSGLMLYWLVSNVWQVAQQLWVNKHTDTPTGPPAPAVARARS